MTKVRHSAKIATSPTFEKIKGPRIGIDPLTGEEFEYGIDDCTAKFLKGEAEYDPIYCEMLIDHAKKINGTFCSFSNTVGIDRDTLNEWARQHPEFKAAKQRAFEIQSAAWEKVGIRGMVNKIPFFNHGVWIFYMKARFGWSELGPQDQDTGELEFV